MASGGGTVVNRTLKVMGLIPAAAAGSWKEIMVKKKLK
jgi:hypothetical protein